ncbi:MAG: hypothetical protein AAF267_05470 [Deinococcota bacterium]
MGTDQRVKNFLVSLEVIEDWPGQSGQIRIWFEKGEIQLLVDLAYALEHESCATSNEIKSDFLDEILKVLAFADGLDHILAFVEVYKIKRTSALGAGTKRRKNNVRFISVSLHLGVLAARQSTKTLCYLLENYRKLGLDL